VAALFTKFDPRAFLDGGRNASAAAAGEKPSLATLAGLAGREAHSEKPGGHTLFITGALDTNARSEGATAKAAKLAKTETVFELLQPGNDGWTAEDWRARFAERAAAAEFRRGLSPAEAELWAFEAVVIEWLNANPSPSPAGLCRWCSKSETVGACVLPFGTNSGTHAWLHAECWPAWHQARRAEAVAALRAIGIRA
jgi:hypothetical protein